MAERPIIRVPEGWTYDEKSAFECGRWASSYTVTHDACGTVIKEHATPVGDGGDGWWYRDQAARGLLFGIGMHTECTPQESTEGTDGK